MFIFLCVCEFNLKCFLVFLFSSRVKNSEGETACSLARKSGFLECARNLEMAALGSINESRRTVVDDMEVQNSRNLHEKALSDILMDKEVKKNRKLVGGRKRTLEDLDEGIFKYLRQGGKFFFPFDFHNCGS